MNRKRETIPVLSSLWKHSKANCAQSKTNMAWSAKELNGPHPRSIARILVWKMESKVICS